MKKIQFIVGLFAAALLVASCSEDYNHHNLSNNPITFTPTIENSDWNAGETRGTLFTGTSFGNNDVFGVSAYRYDGTTLTAATAPANFMYKTQISRVYGYWCTEEPYYWPADNDKLDFYAYYPYNHANVVPKSQETPGPMQIVYTVNSNPLQQVDLMTAHAKNCTFDNSTAVDLSFSHELTAINLVLGDNVAPGYIKSISFEHIATQGTLTVGTGWSEKNDATFTLDMKAYYDSTNGFKTTDNDNNIVTGDAANLTAQTTTLLMIPQTFGNSNQKLKVLFVNEENPEGIYLVTTLTDPWVAGGTLTYQLTTSNINVLKIAEVKYPATSTWGNAYIRNAYVEGEQVGIYAIDAQGNVQVDNAKLTYTNNAWVDDNGSTPLYTPGLRWFMYYPWKNGGLAHEGKKNNVTVTTAEDFFETGVTAWVPDNKQNTLTDLIKQDLQIATGVQTQASTLRFYMAHTMGVLHLTIDPAADAYDIIYYNGNEGVSSTTEVSKSGLHTYTPSRNFTNSNAPQPFLVDESLGYYLFIGRPGDLTITANHSDNVYNAWDVVANTASYTATGEDALEANKYKTHRIENKCGNRGYVKRGWAFEYTGSGKSFTVPLTGSYTLECWGSDGGNCTRLDVTHYGGIGGYVSGDIELTQGMTLYCYVGNQSGFNGGGTIGPDNQFPLGSNGGGSTDFRLTQHNDPTYNTTWGGTASLRSRIIVAAGGGGANVRLDGYGEGDGGYGGGLEGGDGQSINNSQQNAYMNSYGGKQHEGGKVIPRGGYEAIYSSAAYRWYGAFGYAQAFNVTFIPDAEAWNIQTPGGGGWYGGGGWAHSGGGGGSSFISGMAGCNGIDASTGNHRGAGYPSIIGGVTYTFGNPVMHAGNSASRPANPGGVLGYARITETFIE